MKLNLVTIISMLVYVTFTSCAHAKEATEFIALLKKHYENTSSIKAFSLTHSYLGRSDPYQSWDYKAPSRYKAFKVTDIDLEKKHYYQNVVHHFTGGLFYDEVHFQNNSESLRYERNGIALGKGVIKQSMTSFERYKNLTLMNLDFFAVRPLLAEADVGDKINFQLDEAAGKVTLIHQTSENKPIEYVFSQSPLRLLSINNKARKRIYIYDNYRTNNGYHFAHSLVKYYNGDAKPSFITRMEKFEVLEQIDQERLTLPEGYNTILPERNSMLSSREIATDLYLITDSSAITNTLFKVNGDNIMVFGAPTNNKSSERAINTIYDRFPNKKINAVYITHPYSDHIAGLLPYVERGAIVYADEYTIEAIKAFPRFSKVINKFSFETLTHEQMLDGVRFYVLENSRSKRQSFAYFEQSGIIYQSDFLEVAFDNTIAELLPNYSKQFITFVRNKKLEVSRIVGHHRNNNISPEIMDKSYHANTM